MTSPLNFYRSDIFPLKPNSRSVTLQLQLSCNWKRKTLRTCNDTVGTDKVYRSRTSGT